MIGESIGNFRIVARLGGGGMGDVYLAEQAAIDTKVAIKLLKPEISRDKDHVQRFFNEARAVGKIKHAGTVKIFEGGFHPSGHAYLVMEYLDGETLAARIQRASRLSVGSISDIGRQIASILAATHAVGITHRDLKPDNVFIAWHPGEDERVKILDWGIAKLLLPGGAPMKTLLAGTPHFMSPEVVDAQPIDTRADLWSLAVMLYLMLSGRMPFGGTDPMEVMRAVRQGDVEPPSRVLPRLGPRMDAFFAKALARDIRRRFQTIDELEAAFLALVRQRPAPARSPAAAPRRLAKEPAPPPSGLRASVLLSACAPTELMPTLCSAGAVPKDGPR
jgi:serine/threonine protein kinase